MHAADEFVGFEMGLSHPENPHCYFHQHHCVIVGCDVIEMKVLEVTAADDDGGGDENGDGLFDEMMVGDWYDHSLSHLH